MLIFAAVLLLQCFAYTTRYSGILDTASILKDIVEPTKDLIISIKGRQESLADNSNAGTAWQQLSTQLKELGNGNHDFIAIYKDADRSISERILDLNSKFDLFFKSHLEIAKKKSFNDRSPFENLLISIGHDLNEARISSVSLEESNRANVLSLIATVNSKFDAMEPGISNLSEAVKTEFKALKHALKSLESLFASGWPKSADLRDKSYALRKAVDNFESVLGGASPGLWRYLAGGAVAAFAIAFTAFGPPKYPEGGTEKEVQK